MLPVLKVALGGLWSPWIVDVEDAAARAPLAADDILAASVAGNSGRLMLKGE